MRVLPYVYICTHKVTKEFYIGVRLSNKVQSTQDLGFIYRTSSKDVKSRFDEFNYYIYAEFFKSDDAWYFEQELIRLNKDNPLLLNKGFYKEGTLCFHTSGRNRTDEEKRRISEAKTGKKRSPFTRRRRERLEIQCVCEYCGSSFSKFFSKKNKLYYIKYRFCSPSCKNITLGKERQERNRLNK